MWREHGFEILFILAIITLIVITIYNLLSGAKGSYNDYSTYIKTLMGKRISKPTRHKPVESRGEKECRRAIEELTNKPFPKSRPSFLKNCVSGHNLELDCFNSELKMAVEYNGQQHYKYTPYFHSSKEAFYNIKYRDDMKKRLCDENHIKLIVVPHTVKLENIKSYISERM